MCFKDFLKRHDINNLSSESELTIHVDGTKVALWSGCPRSRVEYASRRVRVAGAAMSVQVRG